GAQVTITGTGFSPTANDINIFGHKAMTVSSADGMTLSFAFPRGIVFGCDNVSPVFPPYTCDPVFQQFNAGDQPTISVSNVNGASNSQTFTVTAGSAASINVASPSGGESWALGSTHSIQWT